jgi:hypothetical protein
MNVGVDSDKIEEASSEKLFAVLLESTLEIANQYSEASLRNFSHYSLY